MGQRKLKTPYKDFLPPLSTQEREALKASIKAEGGVRDPIIVDENGNILDGHTRYELYPSAPTLTKKGLTEAEKKAFVYQANFHRRNLSQEQKKELLKAMKQIAFDLRSEDPKKNTQARVAALLGITQKTVSMWFGTNIPKYKPSAPTGGFDARTKIPPEKRAEILARVTAGEPTRQIAADWDSSDRQIRSIVSRERKQQEKKQERHEAVKALGGELLGIHHGDFQEIGASVGDDSVDLIFTDPPYKEEAIKLYEAMAAFAKRTLKPGGWCLAYSGQQFLPDVLTAMWKHLLYGWTFAIGHSGGDLRFRKYRLQNKWKPIVGFYKPSLDVWWDWFPDFTTGGREKDEHEWQQAEAEAAHFIAALSPTGGIVCDPMCGSGTTCVAAKRLARQWIGFEAEARTAEDARIRLARTDDSTAKGHASS